MYSIRETISQRGKTQIVKLCVKITCLVSTMCLVQVNRINKTCKAFILTVVKEMKEYSLRENVHITYLSCGV
jgi:hypothetical protein